MVGGLFKNLKYKVEFYRENILINDNVMECCKEMQVRRARACPVAALHPPPLPSKLH
jgi:GDP-L-fucose synthase